VGGQSFCSQESGRAESKRLEIGTSERSKAVGGDEEGPSRRSVKGSRSYEGGPTR
jgi:hypothetical protein